MKVRVKRLTDNAKLPFRKHKTDAGFDLYATSIEIDEHGNVSYGTGIAMEIPEGYTGFIFPRSSISKKTLSLSNSVGVIDSDYRGEISFKFKPTLKCHNGEHTKGVSSLSIYPDIYEIGDRIGQIIIMPIPKIVLKETNCLGETERGSGGFGSTGN